MNIRTRNGGALLSEAIYHEPSSWMAQSSRLVDPQIPFPCTRPLHLNITSLRSDMEVKARTNNARLRNSRVPTRKMASKCCRLLEKEKRDVSLRFPPFERKLSSVSMKATGKQIYPMKLGPHRNISYPPRVKADNKNKFLAITKERCDRAERDSTALSARALSARDR